MSLVSNETPHIHDTENGGNNTPQGFEILPVNGHPHILDGAPKSIEDVYTLQAEMLSAILDMREGLLLVQGLYEKIMEKGPEIAKDLESNILFSSMAKKFGGLFQ